MVRSKENVHISCQIGNALGIGRIINFKLSQARKDVLVYFPFVTVSYPSMLAMFLVPVTLTR